MNNSTFASKVNKILQGESKLSSPAARSKKTNMANEEKLEEKLKMLEKEKIIMELREENLSLKEKLQSKSSPQPKNNQISTISHSQNSNYDKQLFNPFFQKIVEESSFTQLQHCSSLRDLTNKLQFIFGGNFTFSVQSLLDIAKSLEESLSEDSSKNAADKFFKEINENLNNFPANQIHQCILKMFIEFKQELKKQSNLLQERISKSINEKQSIFRSYESASTQKVEEMMKSLSQNLSFLKDHCGKREQQLKKQINLLEGKLGSAINDSLVIINSQNQLIAELRESLLQLRDSYHTNFQIPIGKIRQEVQKQIQRLRLQMSNANRNINIKDLIGNLIETLKKYEENRSSANYSQIEKHVREIGEKLSVVNDHSLKTIEQLREVVDQNRENRVKINIGQKVSELSEKLCSKRKVKEEIELQVKYFKQKQYIQALEKYTKKIEQSILRNQPSLSVSLREQWQNFEGQYRTREKEFSIRLDNLQAELSNDTRQLLQTKKAALQVLQTQKSLVTLFEGFQSQIGVVKSFKDQLFNFLENELGFRKQMNHQIQIFNRVFVEQFTKLSDLQDSLPKTPKLGTPQAAAEKKLISSFKDATANAERLAQQYQKIFKTKEKTDPHLNKSLAKFQRIHSEYSKLIRQRSPISINIEGQVKFDKQDILIKLQSLVSTTKKSSEAISSNLEKFNSLIQEKKQQNNQIKQFIKNCKLQQLIHKAFDMISQRQSVLLDLQKYLSIEQGNAKEKVC